MAQLDADQYIRLSGPEPVYGQSHGLYWDKTNSLLVLAIDGSVVASVDSAGAILAGALEAPDLNISGQTRGDLIRRGASAWQRVAAVDAGKVVMGDGTDVVSQAITGDVTLAGTGATTVTDLTIASEARGDLLRRGASAWERVAAKTAGQVMIGDGTDITSKALVGDIASVDGSGTVTFAQHTIKYYSVTISSADITGTGAGQFGHANGYPLLSAPAAGEVIEFLSAVIMYDYATAAYTAGGNVSVNYAGGGAALSGTVSAANSFGAAGDKIAVLLPTTPTNNQLSAATGVNLVTSAAFTQPGTAAGVARVKIAYRIHTTGL